MSLKPFPYQILRDPNVEPTGQTIADTVAGDDTRPTEEAPFEYTNPVTKAVTQLTKAELTARMAELDQVAEKVRGADAAFRERAELKKTLDELQSTIAGFKNRDEKSFRKMAEMLGVDAQHPGLADEIWGVLSASPDATAPSSTPRANPTPVPTSTTQPLPESLQELVTFATDRGISPAKAIMLALRGIEKMSEDEVQTTIKKRLTEHPLCGKIVKQKPDTMKTLSGRVFTDVKDRVETGTPLEDAIRGALDDVSSIVAAALPVDTGSAYPSHIQGIGPAPVSAPTSLHPGERPKVDPRKLKTDPGALSDVIDQIAAANYDELTE